MTGLFPDLPRTIKPRRQMMHCIDVGGQNYGVHYQCGGCQHKAWAEYESEPSITEIRRGVPCPKCNNQQE